LILSITGSTAWSTLSPFFRHTNLSHQNKSLKKRWTYSFLFHVDDESPIMKYANAEKMDIPGIDLLRCLRCLYIASCRNQCFKMISIKYLENKVRLEIFGIEKGNDYSVC
jgi:hypothetical protein